LSWGPGAIETKNPETPTCCQKKGYRMDDVCFTLT
jgi:hypothetical protein